MQSPETAYLNPTWNTPRIRRRSGTGAGRAAAVRTPPTHYAAIASLFFFLALAATVAPPGGGHVTRALAAALHNSPPRIVSMKIVLIDPSDPRQGFRAVVEAEDPDGDPVRIHYQWYHNGRELIGEQDEKLEWQEGFKKGDELVLEAVPFDGKDEGVWRAEGSIKIPNTPPRMASEPIGRMEDGVFTMQVEAHDPDGDPLAYTLEDAPPGMEIDPATGRITWNVPPESAGGKFTVKVTASDGDGGTATQVVVLTLPPPPTPLASP